MKLHVDSYQNKNVCLIFILFLYGLIVLSPWFFNYQYNYDLKMYASILDTISKQTIVESIFNNVFLFYFIKRVFVTIDNFILMNFLQNVFVTILVFSLYKNTGKKITLAIILLGFFSLFLGQIREALAIAFCVMALFSTKRYSMVVFFILALLSHFFLFSLFFLIFIYQKLTLNKISSLKKILVFILFFLIIMAYFSSDKRYQFYAIIQSRYSFFFIVPVLLFLIVKENIKNSNEIIGILIIIATLTIPFYSFSNRLSEALSFIILIFYSYFNKYKNFNSLDFIKFYNNNLKKNDLILGVATLVFLYRFFNVIIFEGSIRN